MFDFAYALDNMACATYAQYRVPFIFCMLYRFKFVDGSLLHVFSILPFKFNQVNGIAKLTRLPIYRESSVAALPFQHNIYKTPQTAAIYIIFNKPTIAQ